jgi:hypothetical protein
MIIEKPLPNGEAFLLVKNQQRAHYLNNVVFVVMN